MEEFNERPCVFFLWIVVGDGGSLGNVAHGVDGPGCQQDSFRQRGFTAGGMTNQGYIADFFGGIARH